MANANSQVVPLRRRSGPVRATVTQAELVTPALRRVTLVCDQFAAARDVPPAAWVRGYFPLAAAPASQGPSHRPGNEELAGMAARAYTIVGLRAGTFALDFVLHGRGPAACWAADARPGDTLDLVGPLGRGQVEPRRRRHLFAGDTTALPAIREWLTAIDRTEPDPAGPPEIAVHLWAPAASERQELLTPANTAVTWHLPDGPSFADLAEAGALAPPGWHPSDPATKFFIAGEAGAVTRARRAIVAAGRPAPGNLHAVGYWRAGAPGDPAALARVDAETSADTTHSPAPTVNAAT
ncbi:MAG: siderophore-interacting protein [Bifidobacteriaceae bacterium]|jgi:NADPH-dependent ferric siderophore reductase|nr:siderophore-interacting protein [Bifidobacteriaceae bacterium]